MKAKFKTFSFIALPLLFSLLFSLLLAACEPTDWEVILAPPEPVTGLSASGHSGNDITFNFTLPEFSEQVALFPDYSIMVYYYSRPDAGVEETYHGYLNYGPADFGSTHSAPVTIDTLSAVDYVFILYTVDNEYQKSEPTETGTVSW